MDLGTVLNKLKLEQYRNPDLCRLDVIQVAFQCLHVYMNQCLYICMYLCEHVCMHA